MESLTGIQAIQWAKEISKLPEGNFTLSFFPYSRSTGKASSKLVTKTGCKFRAQLPQERFSIGSENFFLFTDGNGEPRMCYRILIRYIGLPQDNYQLHKVDWL